MCHKNKDRPVSVTKNHFVQERVVVFLALRAFVKTVPRTHRADEGYGTKEPCGGPGPKGQSLTLASRIGTYIYGDVGCSAVRMLLLYQDLQGPRAIGPGVRLADRRSTY